MGQASVRPPLTSRPQPRRAVRVLRGVARINLAFILAMLIETQLPLPFGLFLYVWFLISLPIMVIPWPAVRPKVAARTPRPVLSFQNVEPESAARWHEQWHEHSGRPTIVVPGSATYWTPPDPALPRWLSEPYASQDRCWGCGLEPEVMNPGRWILCFWCDELRAVLAARR